MTMEQVNLFHFPESNGKGGEFTLSHERRDGIMKRTMGAVIVLAGVLMLAGCVPAQHASRMRHTSVFADTAGHMTRQDVISLTQAGISDSLIVSMMDASRSYFQLTTQDVLDLKNAGVREPVIKAMLAAPPEEAENVGSDDVRYRAVPPYWYMGYNPYWDPWYSSMYSYGYGHYRPVYAHRSYPMHYGGFGTGRGFAGHSGGGRRR
jgi:hypothetical protein